jgi:hypothetical protein
MSTSPSSPYAPVGWKAHHLPGALAFLAKVLRRPRNAFEHGAGDSLAHPLLQARNIAVRPGFAWKLCAICASILVSLEDQSGLAYRNLVTRWNSVPTPSGQIVTSLVGFSLLPTPKTHQGLTSCTSGRKSRPGRNTAPVQSADELAVGADGLTAHPRCCT